MDGVILRALLEPGAAWELVYGQLGRSSSFDRHFRNRTDTTLYNFHNSNMSSSASLVPIYDTRDRNMYSTEKQDAARRRVSMDLFQFQVVRSPRLCSPTDSLTKKMLC